MAQLFPDDIEAVAQEHRFHGEIATLLRLRDELPDQCAVFHGVHWTKVEDDAAIYGEIDFLIVNSYGKVLAIEQKETAIEQDASPTKLQAVRSEALYLSMSSCAAFLRLEGLSSFP